MSKKSLTRTAILSAIRVRITYKDWEFYDLPADGDDASMLVSIYAEVAHKCGVSFRRAKWAVQKYI